MSPDWKRRFTDFAVGSHHLHTDEETRAVNVAFFATYEPIRLWLRLLRMKAPFTKLYVELVDETSSRTHGYVQNVDGVCSITEAVSMVALRERASDQRWVISHVHDALRHVAEKEGWRSLEFEAWLVEIADKPWPLVHYFDKLRAKDRRSGIECLPWVSFQPGVTRIGVRISQPGKPDRDVEVFTAEEHPYFWDRDFPLAQSRIQSGYVLLLDKTGKTLASVPIDKDALH